MKYFVALFIGLLVAGQSLAVAQQIPVYSFSQLEKTISGSPDTVYVVNFWATWCKPCIEELPHFESVTRQYANQKVKVLLVSMDYKDDLATKVKPFVTRRKLQSDVVLLDEPDANAWIDKISPEWSGAIPVTLIVHRAKNIRQFIGKPVKAGELEKIIDASL